MGCDTRQFELYVLHSSPLIRGAISDLFREDPDVAVLVGSPHLHASGLVPGNRQPDATLVEYEHWRQVGCAVQGGAGARVVLYGRENSPHRVVDCLRANVAGFVDESCPPDSLVRGLRTVLRGQNFWHLDYAERVGQPLGESGKWRLSSREEQILGLLLRRRSNEEIAGELCLTQQTVKNYASRVFRKIGVSGRKELFRRLQPHG